MLCTKLAKFFSEPIRQKGLRYVQLGRVRVTAMQESGMITASLHSRGLEYDIAISVSPPHVVAACTCGRLVSQAKPCSHVWAALLHAESQLVYHEWCGKLGLGTNPAQDLRLEIRTTAPAPPDGKPPPSATGGSTDRTSSHVPPAGLTSALGEPMWVIRLRELGRGRIPSQPPPPEHPGLTPIYVLSPRKSSSHVDRFVLELLHRPAQTGGKPGRTRWLQLRPSDIPRMPEPIDRQICLMLVGGAGDDVLHDASRISPSRSIHVRPGRSTWQVANEHLGALLPLLIKTGRFELKTSDAEGTTGTTHAIPLRWERRPWEFVLRIQRGDLFMTYELAGLVRKKHRQLAIDMFEPDVLIAGPNPIVVHEGVISPLRDHGCGEWVEFVRSHPRVTFNRADLGKFMEELAAIAPLPPVEWPGSWNIPVLREIVPQPELALVVRDNHAEGTLTFDYEGVRVAARAPGCTIIEPQNRRQVLRNTEAEERSVAHLAKLGFKSRPLEGEPILPIKAVPRVIYALLKDGWKVLGDQVVFRRPGAFAIRVRSGIDWFEMEGDVDFEGQQAPLPALLAAARKGQTFVRLGDGSMGMIPEDWLARHSGLLELAAVKDDCLLFSKTQIGLIDALLTEMPDAHWDENLAQARRQLRDFEGLAGEPTPASFAGQLRPYQEFGLAWLEFLQELNWGGCLADDMGLGKTIQVLALFARWKELRGQGQFLVVVPRSILHNWMREIDKFSPSLKAVDYSGIQRHELTDRLEDHDLVLTTYGILRRDIDILRKLRFDYVVLDEAQAIKNPSSLGAKAARLIAARHRLVMTGTPVENHLGDLWSLFEFLNPGMLGSLRAFKGGFAAQPSLDSPRMRSLQQALRPFILRRTKEQVAPELPERIEETLECTMSAKQAAYYQELRDYYRVSLLEKVDEIGLGKSKVHVLEALLRLRQAACHPGLIDPSKTHLDSAKLDALLPILDEIIDEGHKALVFSQFTRLLGIVRRRLDSKPIVYEYLDGRTRDRQERIDRFQSDDSCPLFLISLKAGGVGLNLTAADYVFILDPWWNPATEAQAIDRAHRIGQDKKVFAYRLITRDTVESKIVEMQRSKRDLAGAIITQANSLIQDLTREDLELLLS